MRNHSYVVLCALGLAAFIATAASAEPLPRRERAPSQNCGVLRDPGLPQITVVAGDTIWINAHDTDAACPGSPFRGGEATGGPKSHEVWCFEGGAGDSISTAGGKTYVFRSFDKRTLRNDDDSLYWHADDWQAIAGKSMWCGGTNDRCLSWVKEHGYGRDWQQIMQLDLPGPFNLTRGCSLQFRTRYVTECFYDYGNLELYSFRRGKWYAVDRFNGKSGCAALVKPCTGDWNNSRMHTGCPSSPYGDILYYPGSFNTAPKDSFGFPYVLRTDPAQSWVLLIGDTISSTPASTPIRLRWRFQSDVALDTQDGRTQVYGWWIDDVVMRANGTTIYSYDFNSLANGALPPAQFWSFPHLEPIYDGWAIRYDMDPPLEGYFLPSPGDSGTPSACQINASWQWSITPSGTLIPPPEDPRQPIPGMMVMLTTPAIPLDYTDGDLHQGPPPFSAPAVVVQFDDIFNLAPETDDYAGYLLRAHKVAGDGPWEPTGAWCPWEYAWGAVFMGVNAPWWIDDQFATEDFTTPSGIDSVQFAWMAIDFAAPGSPAWDPNLPPHVGTQFVVDNVSIGLVDGTSTVFTLVVGQDQFQDTFNTRSCMHSAMTATGDLGYGRYRLHDRTESLAYTITDTDGLTSGNVKIWYSINGGGFVPKNMYLPHPKPDGTGGEFRTTLCDTPWTPGTEIRWYLSVQDNLGHVAYLPRGANPDSVPRAFYQVEILPTPGTKILLVDDYNSPANDYAPCRSDTVARNEASFYSDVLQTLGYGYMAAGGFDTYNVNRAAVQSSSEPWGFWKADPATPDSGYRTYDIVIWTTGQGLALQTIQDTTQEFLEQFVFHGGRALVSGDAIGTNLSDPSVHSWPDFYDKLLGAQYVDQMPDPLRVADLFPLVPRMVAAPGGILVPGDSAHIYVACPRTRRPMDKITLADTTGWTPPLWSHPRPYLLYQDASAPYDSLAGIFVKVDKIPGQTGQVVYLPWSLSALVDDWRVTCDPPPSTPPGQDVGLGTFQGRAEILTDILGIFGQPVPATSVGSTTSGQRVNSLSPAQPNPFNPTTSIRFSLASRARVTLTVFDVAGRRVARLVDEIREAGPHEMVWNGKNDAGHTVASGVYFARMETKGFSATEKLTLLK